MLDSAGHLQQAERFESFLKTLPSDTPYREWVIVLWFYIALHYVEAFLMTIAPRSRTHDTRRIEMVKPPQTNAILIPYHQLYKASREARYDGTPFIAADLARYEPMFRAVKQAMRQALALP